MALVKQRLYIGGEQSYRARLPESIRGVVIHRINVGETVQSIDRFFRENPDYTGGKFPYHIVGYRNGDFIQCVELGFIAPGARSLNKQYVQLALIGDFRKEPPTAEQSLALTPVVTCICEWVGTPHVIAHDSVKDASLDPSKECPGDLLPVKALQNAVAHAYNVRDALEAEQRLIEMGLVI